MPFLTTTGTPQPQTVQTLASAGWTIIHDGPSGTQLIAPRQMRLLDKIAMVVGVILLFLFWPLGVFLILMAIIDFYALTPREKKFIPRDQP